MKTTVPQFKQVEENQSLDFFPESQEVEFNALDNKIDSVGLFLKYTVLCFSLYFLFEVLL